MSTETTNKKIKIDNGTTFGRTYTDKAVDELLKGVGGNSVGVIKLNESQLATFNDNNTVTFTAEQIEILKNENISNVLLDLTAQTMLFNKYVLIAGNQFIYCILITYTPESQNAVQLYTVSFDLTEPCTFVSHSIPIENYIKTFDINDVFLKLGKSTNYGSSTSLVTYKMGRINNKPLLVTEDKPLPDFTFTEDKTIPLFGEHSILVPKDSSDTNILPCTTADNGKVLSVVNGQAQWASASGGSGGDAFDVITTTDGATYTGTISGTKPVLLNMGFIAYLANSYASGEAVFATIGISDKSVVAIQFRATYGKLQVEQYDVQRELFSHFITLTNSTSTFYLTYQNTSAEKLNTLDSLKTALAGKYLLCTGHTGTGKAEYISGKGGNIVVGVVNNSDNSTSDITIDSSFTITDLVSPVE